jgi:hypothetical protein
MGLLMVEYTGQQTSKASHPKNLYKTALTLPQITGYLPTLIG